MNRLIRVVLVIFVAFFAVQSAVWAATLQLLTVGGVTVGSSGTITTTDTTPSLIGKASPEATVDINIDDLTVAVLANSSGDWSYTPVSPLSAATHTLKISSNLESLTFSLVIGSAVTPTATPAATTTSIGGVSTTSSVSTLPASGAVENTFLMIIGGLFLMGLGVVTHQSLPVSEEIPEEKE